MPTAVDLTQAVISNLKVAMRHMPSPVAIVTATDPVTKLPCGLAVTAYIPVSMDPPSMQICINRSASAYGALLAAGSFAINVLGIDCEPVLRCFSDPAKKSDRFSGEHWQFHKSLPYLPQANTTIFCRIAEKHDFGTHTAIIGLVDEVFRGDVSPPAVWLESKLCPVDSESHHVCKVAG